MCVNEMNKSGEMVNKAQLKENERCLMDFQKQRLNAPPMTFNTCMFADRKGSVRKAEERTATREDKKCDSLDAPPHFAYTDSETVNVAAMDGARALVFAIFGGPPVLDANLSTQMNDKVTAKCQIEMLKRANKLESVVLKEIVKAKKQALKNETVDDAAALDAQLELALSLNYTVIGAEDRFAKGVDRACRDLVATPGAVFPGSCAAGDPDLDELEDCVVAAARCAACAKINAFDDLNLDCDQMDDGTSNESCP